MKELAKFVRQLIALGMSTVTGQHAPKLVEEVYESDNVKLLFQLNLEVRHVKEVQQNKKYVTRKNAQRIV